MRRIPSFASSPAPPESRATEARSCQGGLLHRPAQRTAPYRDHARQSHSGCHDFFAHPAAPSVGLAWRCSTGAQCRLLQGPRRRSADPRRPGGLRGQDLLALRHRRRRAGAPRSTRGSGARGDGSARGGARVARTGCWRGAGGALRPDARHRPHRQRRPFDHLSVFLLRLKLPPECTHVRVADIHEHRRRGRHRRRWLSRCRRRARPRSTAPGRNCCASVHQACSTCSRVASSAPRTADPSAARDRSRPAPEDGRRSRSSPSASPQPVVAADSGCLDGQKSTRLACEPARRPTWNGGTPSPHVPRRRAKSHVGTVSWGTAP